MNPRSQRAISLKLWRPSLPNNNPLIKSDKKPGTELTKPTSYMKPEINEGGLTRSYEFGCLYEWKTRKKEEQGNKLIFNEALFSYKGCAFVLLLVVFLYMYIEIYQAFSSKIINKLFLIQARTRSRMSLK